MRSEGRQLDVFRNREPTAEEWRIAADAARRNPYETPADSERRARYYEDMARKAESRQ